MDAETLGLIELIFVFGTVLGFGFWQLYSVRRDMRRAKQRDGEDGQDRASGP